ncbi:hypothetical protein EDD16DRAFT_1712573 [Pisolithus croceorrhizus]|nr:hypothetical protein EV401DRAFT_913963 [Pisolithus croceorrhizus]KAI6107223.1 hypothetical protein EDD16DRAFT_1712573 [Pisolithus croceorrhizus]KAI6143187.1 hypothetical protein EDD17DRAFT_213006 [Pisolithus thermaeus]
MDNFSYKDSIRAAFASCSSCFTAASSSNATVQSPNAAISRSDTPGSNDLERLLRDADSDALSLHSNIGASSRRRARQRRRPKFSLTLFGYTLFGRPPIYLSDDEDEGTQDQHRTLTTTSSFTFDSDAAPLDANAIERLTSPDHRANVQRELEMHRRNEQERATRRAQRRARREERRANAQTSALMALSGGAPAEDGGLEGSRGSSTVPSVGGVEVVYPTDTGSNSDDADDADLGAETYVRRKGQAHGRNGSSSDSRSRTSASVSTGDGVHTQENVLSVSQSIPYSQTVMQLPDLPQKKTRRSSRRTSLISSSTTSQSTSNAPYTPPPRAEYVSVSPPVASFPVPQEREEGSYVHDLKGGSRDFPITGLSGNRRPKSKDIGTFLSGMNDV